MEENQTFPIKKSFVIFTIIFDFLTGGIYSASWFLIRRQGFNQISKTKKLGMSIPIISIIMLVLNLMFSVAGGAIAGVAEATQRNDLVLLANQLEVLCKALAYVGGFLLLFPCFRAKAILEEHLKSKDRFALSLSGAATFFFRIYYLQYRINKIHKETASQQVEPIVKTSDELGTATET